MAGVSITAHQRGHRIYWDDARQGWFYADTGDPASVERPCAKCGRMPTPEGYDPCLGYIPEARAACCGHGVEPGYVMLESGVVYSALATEYRLTIPGRPVPAQRMTQRTKWTPQAQRSLAYQRQVAQAAIAARIPRPLPWEYIGLAATVYLRPTRGGSLPGNRGDADNYLKALADGLQHASVLGNDRAVIDESIRIRPALDGEERVEVILREAIL